MSLLAADRTPIAPPAAPADDRAPDSLAAGTPAELRDALAARLGADRVLSSASDLVRYASDASPYRFFPQAVLMAHDAHDVGRALDFARRHGVPVTFRAAGTSLNGQAQGDGLLVDVRRHWVGVEALGGGARARVRPGTVLGRANEVLLRHGRRLGPDPASTDAATVGGVIANNSGGMRCGTTEDSYSTLRSLTLILPSGTVIDTAAPDAEERFAAAEPELARGLVEIREEILADADLTERIRRKFEIKNTTGYRLVAFLDADTPLEIFRRLVVGSEGTLAFIAEAVFDTVPVGAFATTGLFLFGGIDAAVSAVPALVGAGARAVELMVTATLVTASHVFEGTPEAWRELPLDGAALLVEFRSDDESELDEREAKALEILSSHELLEPAAFTRDRALTETYWRVREGMHGLVAQMRPQGTALIVEDVCVPPERIGEAATDVKALLGEHGFIPGVAGHASAGNLHFMLTPDLTKAEDRERYDAFMARLVDLVVDKYDGSLKAEHGTGRNMAPFVEREWGAKATELMWRIKRLADPDGVLAPGIVLDRDPGAHLRGLKSYPVIEDVAKANACMECGFCEPVCPSRHLTTTPRQRIVLRREMARQPEGSPVRRALLEQYEYDAIETCATDGTCALVCPAGIDTGKLVKELRAQGQRPAAEGIALRAARRWDVAERAARGGLRAGEAIARAAGDAPLRGATRALRRAVGDELVPEWTDGMPRAAAPGLPPTQREGAAAVYFPACINRIFGASPRDGDGDGDGSSLPAALVAISQRARRPVWIPPDAAGHCCATPWQSKGYRDGAAFMAKKVVEALWRWSDEGRLPVVVDASSCTAGIAQDVEPLLDDANRERHAALTVLDSIAWAATELLPRLELKRRLGSVTVHPPCSVRHLRLLDPLAELAGALAEEVVVPAHATCCGFAGDRGFLHPELTAAATRDEAVEVAERSTDAYVCSNRTCEVGLERATGAPFTSIVGLLEELTRE